MPAVTPAFLYWTTAGDEMSIENKTILITGASKGIGEATARHFVENGANVILAARSGDTVQSVAAQLGPRARGIACDVAKYDQVKSAVDLAVESFGRLDILLNNAGLLEPIHRLADFDPADWDKVIDVNVKGVFYGMHAAIPIMLSQRSGTIINISSGAAYNALEGWSHYCASKAAVLQLTRSGHKEYGDLINVVGLSPGTVATDMQVTIKSSGMNPVSQLEVSDHIPPSDVARAVEYLCGAGGPRHAGADFSIKTPEGRAEAGLPPR